MEKRKRDQVAWTAQFFEDHKEGLKQALMLAPFLLLALALIKIDVRHLGFLLIASAPAIVLGLVGKVVFEEDNIGMIIVGSFFNLVVLGFLSVGLSSMQIGFTYDMLSSVNLITISAFTTISLVDLGLLVLVSLAEDGSQKEAQLWRWVKFSSLVLLSIFSLLLLVD